MKNAKYIDKYSKSVLFSLYEQPIAQKCVMDDMFVSTIQLYYHGGKRKDEEKIINSSSVRSNGSRMP